jgi:hypothetical protein
VPAAGIAVLYALGTILLLLVMAAAISPMAPAAPAGDGETPPAGIFEIFLVVFLVLMILRDPGIFELMVLGVLAVGLLPSLIAVSFSIWVATRPPAPATT